MDGSLVVKSNLTSTMKTLVKEKWISSLSRIWKILADPQKLEPRFGDVLTRISGQFQGGSVIRLSLGGRSVKLLPIAQRTNALTPWQHCSCRFYALIFDLYYYSSTTAIAALHIFRTFFSGIRGAAVGIASAKPPLSLVKILENVNASRKILH